MTTGRDRIRVLHLVTHYKGSPRLFVDLVSGLDRGRFESIICYCSRDSEEESVLGKMGFPEFFLDWDGKPVRSSFSALTIRRLRRFLRDHPVDLVHTQKYSGAVYAGAAAPAGRPPILLMVHSMHRFRRLRRRLTGLWLGWRVSRFIAVSDSIREDVLGSAWGIPHEKVVTVRNGIDPRPFIECDVARREARAVFGLPEDGLVIGAVGRLDPMKAHLDLIEAFHRSLSGRRDAVLAIAGEGRLRPRLEERIASLGLEGRVLLLGRRRDVPVFLRAVDVFALSSTGEGLPLALLEAMASGLPVVSTRAAGVAETVEGLEGALVTEPRDVDGLAGSLFRMAEKPADERTRLGAENRGRVLEGFTRERMVRDMEQVYLDVLSGRGGR